MEHEIHSVYSLFWRNAYVAALQAGHQDPAAAADEAFMAFDCRFGETEEVLGTMTGCGQQQQQSTDGAWGLGVLGMAKQADVVIAEQKRQEWINHVSGGLTVVSTSTANPSTEGLPPVAEKSDDEVLG